MRQILSLTLVALMITQLGPAVSGADSVTSEITGMPAGTNIEVHLKNKESLRGTRGDVSTSGFTLVNTNTGNRQVAFDDVSSVKEMTHRSHKTRNILIITGVALVVVVTALAIQIKRCPVGCN